MALGALVDAGLIRGPALIDGERRFQFFEAVREYAFEQLTHLDCFEQSQRLHADYFLRVAEEASPHLSAGADYLRWLRLLGLERDNLRAALRWCVERGDVERGMRVAGAVWRYWFLDGTNAQVGEWLDAMLRLLNDDQSRTIYRARVLAGAGVLSARTGDLVR